MNKTEKLKNLREKLHILENHNTGLRERIKRKNEEISQLNRDINTALRGCEEIYEIMYAYLAYLTHENKEPIEIDRSEIKKLFKKYRYSVRYDDDMIYFAQIERESKQ